MNFLSFIRPYRRRIAVTLFYILTANVLALALPWGIKMIIDDVLIRRDTRLLHLIIVILVGILILRSIFNFLRKITSNKIGEHIVCDLRERLYWHIHNLSLTSIKKITPAQILTRITGDVDSIRRFIFSDCIDFIYAVLSVGLISVVLLFINLRLTLTALLVLPLFTLMYLRLLPQLKTGYRRLRDVTGEMAARINEVLNGMNVVRVFTAENYEKRRFDRHQDKILKTANKNHFLNVSLWVAIEAFTSLGLIGVLWLGGMDVIRHRMTPGELIAFYSYLGMLFAPIIRLIVINGSYQEASAALRRINEITSINDHVHTVASPITLTPVKGFVEFDDVSFGYTPDETILKNISFSVEKGETVGIVGASGAGKTTVINLLLRFFDPQSGAIRIDGAPLTDLNLTDYHRQLAVVLQDDYLFGGTIEENIRYGSFETTPSEIQGAARIAEAHTFIEKFPDGYAEQIGERGLRLSSGQRQRIAIARALIRKPSILVLDEATSAVDALTENKIQKAVAEHLNNITTFIVAHRFSTIMEADKIIVMEKGKIVEMGRHNHLLKNSRFYSNLYLEQFKKDAGGITATAGARS